MRTIVLVHGAWHGPWCWSPVLARLDEADIPAEAIELPLDDLHHDAATVTAHLDAGEGPVVLVGHSYGGSVITEAGVHPRVAHLVYICAFAPEKDESPLGLTLDHDGEWSELNAAIVTRDDGTNVLDPALAPAALFADCAPDDVERALRLLRPQGGGTFAQCPSAVAWRERPVTYAVCGADRAVVPTLQRQMAERIPGAAVVEWPTASHSPYFSMPGAVAELLVGLY